MSIPQFHRLNRFLYSVGTTIITRPTSLYQTNRAAAVTNFASNVIYNGDSRIKESQIREGSQN